MHLSELKALHVSQLLDMAVANEIEGANRLRAAAPTVLALAAAEGLWAHGDAVSVRTDTERPRTSQP